jgi:ESF2/ABP1 family protein
MTPNFVKKLLANYQVERVYLLPESDWVRNNRIKKGGNKRICFREGWLEFASKKEAKVAVVTLNGQKMVGKKGSFYSEDLWNLKYLPKFKWHHLTEKLAHEQRLKAERLNLEMEQERKLHEFYSSQMRKSKKIGGILHQKMAKGKLLATPTPRNFAQKPAIQEEFD